MTTDEYRALRREMRITGLNTRLPIVEREIDALWQELAPLYKALCKASSKHDKEKVYAQFEGRDWKYQHLTAERDNIVAMLAQEVNNGYTLV